MVEDICTYTADDEMEQRGSNNIIPALPCGFDDEVCQ